MPIGSATGGRSRVLLLEAGGRDLNPWIHIPVGYFKTMHNPSVDWCFTTEPDPGINGRSIDWPRGKVLGGSSSINGLLYVRGQPQDYDRWRQMGNPGWGWDDVLPLFRDAETYEGGEDAHRGGSGPLGVTENSVHRRATDAWLEAAVAAGHRRNPDYNGDSQEGVGQFQITSRYGRRCSAAVAYLNPAKGRSNLKVETGAFTERLTFEGKRVTGVQYRDRSGQAAQMPSPGGRSSCLRVRSVRRTSSCTPASAMPRRCWKPESVRLRNSRGWAGTFRTTSRRGWSSSAGHGHSTMM